MKKLFAIILTLVICLVPSMTVLADDNIPLVDRTFTADDGTIWVEADPIYFTFYDNLYTENSHIAIRPSELADIIDIDISHQYNVQVDMRIDKSNAETIRKENVGNGSFYGYTLSNAYVLTDIPYIDLYNYEANGYAIAFELTISDTNSDALYKVTYVLPTLLAFTDFNNNYNTIGDIAKKQEESRFTIGMVVAIAFVMTIILVPIIIAVSSAIDKHNAKRKFVKIIFLPYQIFTKIKNNTDENMIFRLQHTNKNGTAEYITLKRIISGSEPQSIDVNADSNTEDSNEEQSDESEG